MSSAGQHGESGSLNDDRMKRLCGVVDTDKVLSRQTDSLSSYTAKLRLTPPQETSSYRHWLKLARRTE